MKKLIFLLTFLAAALFFATPAFGYTVEKGDTMSKIAQDHGLTLKELAAANPQINNIDLIFVGQQINIHTNKKSNNSPEPQNEVNKLNVSTETTNHNFSKKELDLLARIVRAEAQTEPFEGKVAVADVVLNRLESSQFPDTIKEVIYQPRQFQPVSNGQINKPADQESIEAVAAALTDMRNISQDSLFFYNPDIATSRWLDTRETTIVIGAHVFKN
ncbi:cell wall hydrolase [Alkalihalobacterium chitinilyticum]|uniref:Cell wall hydrolase n=1 Tax=Alkalihalobacterium chitinilyticum TaxID=2980103 RepID=A0ABT5VLM9_9BACI|nr:cell wall hydrolase [Alkalihalobacterium chitinilyticum]MDE5416351.1 cell wall hydrolase [Alkalihalobacterium chitinilyticum]